MSQPNSTPPAESATATPVPEAIPTPDRSLSLTPSLAPAHSPPIAAEELSLPALQTSAAALSATNSLASESGADRIRGRRSSVDVRLLSYQQYMKHQIPILLAQLHSGISVCDRLMQFLKKSTQLQSEFANKLNSLAAIEESKSESVKDGMLKHARAAQLIPSLYRGVADRERAFAEAVEKSLIAPLQAFVTMAESKRISQTDSHTKKSEVVTQKKNEIDKLRLATLKSWDAVTSTKKARDKEIAKEGKAKDKTIKSLAKALETAKKEFSRYEQQSEIAARTIDDFRFTEMPDFLQAVEDLEMSRMAVVKQASEAFAGLIKKHDDSKLANELYSLVPELFGQTDMNSCIDNWSQIVGLPPVDPGAVQELPCKSEQLANGQWETYANDFIIPAHAQSVDAPRSSLTASYVTVQEKATRPVSLQRGPSSMKLASGAADEKIPEESPGGSGAQTPEISQRKDPSNSLPSVNENQNQNQNNSAVPMSLNALAAIDDDDDPDDDDEDEEKDENDTIASLKSERKIKEEWMIAQQDYPPKDQTAADLLHFVLDDIIKVLRKEVDGDASWWFGEVVGYKSRPPGKFPSSAVRLIDDKPVVVDEKEEDNEKTKSLVDMIRGKVSKKKRRYEKDGFNLDLSYITPNIIAMGFPAESLSGYYRNNMKDVQRFLNLRHPASYKVYNLCSEREYSKDKFEGRQARYPFDDHNPSEFNLIEPFCVDVADWLKQAGEAGMAVIHCKAGKGRTGFLISCYLVYCGIFDDATTALRYYAVRRTKNAKGVTIPSQIRYTHYFDRYLKIQKLGLTPLPQVNPVILTSIRIHGIPKVTIGKDIWFKIQNHTAKFNSKGKVAPERRSAEDYIVFNSSNRTGIFSLDGDCQFTFYCGGLFESAKLFQFWFNTRFLVNDDDDKNPNSNRDNSMIQLVLAKSELDKACKDTKHKIFSDTFKIELIFSQA